MNAATQRRVLAQQLHLPLFDTCQRWSGRRTSYRPAGEAFDKRRYGLERIDFGAAKAFVERHHSANTMPAARLQLGLMHKASAAVREQLVGVVVFSVPMQERAIPAWFDGLSPRLGIEIGRLVLLDDVPGNGETFLLGRAFRALRSPLPECLAQRVVRTSWRHVVTKTMCCHRLATALTRAGSRIRFSARPGPCPSLRPHRSARESWHGCLPW